MERFPHLKFLKKVTGKPRLNGGGKSNLQSKLNKENRPRHSGYLSDKTTKLKSDWLQEIIKRDQLGT